MPTIIKHDIYEKSEIERETLLYRITSSGWADKKFLLNGQGAKKSRGRFHRLHQYTSYASDNLLLCICEKLHYMSIAALKKIRNNDYHEFLGEACRDDLIIVIFKVEEIKGIINLESSEARQKYGLNPSTVTAPAFTYNELQQVADTIRANDKGILYPSARHCNGHSVCFFLDHTQKILSVDAKLRLTLKLLSEDLRTEVDARSFDPINKRINYNVGYFKFNHSDFKNNYTKIYPQFTNTEGKISFHRNLYSGGNYPDCALL